MTLPVACPPSNSDLPTVPQQRKRRRRAPASGASDDCFACTKRNLKCDRRRPYCSQCLEIGKECSGYKTQLTWGVGVASRGKLRGLSLPVARSAPAQRSPPPSSRPRSTSTISKAKFQDGDEIQIKMESPSAPNSVHAYTNYDFVNMAPHGTAPPMPMPDWNMAISQEFSATPNYQHDSMRQQRQLPQLQRLHTLSITRGDALGLGPHSPVHDAMSAYAESDYSHSPVSQSFPNDDIPYLNSPVPMYNYSTPTSTTSQSPVVGHIGMMVDSRGPTSCPDQYYAQSDMSSSLSSHQTIYEVEDNRQHQPSPVPQSGHVEMFYTDDIMGSQNRQDMDMYSSSTRSSHGFGNGWITVTDDDVASQAPSEADNYHLNDSMSSSFTSDTSPRISFFMDFYDKVICPSVVVIDSPSNPYREHILSLASSSRSLQHAICALAACNLRMKRKQSLGQEHWRRPSELEQMDHINGGSYTSTQLNQPQQSTIESQTSDSSMQEECRHRSLAVTLLNEQLSDPSKARHDSVLATLFILCHYRMCESGIAQFKTQFAGVKKILGMRESGLETGNWGWMETLFTYFDGIAASINDRETQLRGGFLEMVANPANPNHALENLAGCDSILFKTIAKLGRLNLLAQHRPILPDYPTTHLPLRPAPPQPRPKLAGQALVDFYNLHAHNFDGNGFASTLDDEAFPLGSTGRPHSPSNDDLNTSFWTEWKACRHSLQSWEFDPSRLVAQLQPTPSPTQLRDFGYISEAFRYSALLYTERLACPNLPSSHLNFQNLVSQVLYYVTSLEKDSGAEKFLLWPLFISGSECVNELQQSIVRTKCKEIMGRSGYLNNLAGLEVLEKLWAETQGGSDVMNERVSGGGAFRWARYMDGVDGEWIMV